MKAASVLKDVLIACRYFAWSHRGVAAHHWKRAGSSERTQIDHRVQPGAEKIRGRHRKPALQIFRK
jgi:hypothetical protein